MVVLAQEKDATFEVASVKTNKSGDSNGNLRALPGGRVIATNMPARPIITFAYQLAQYQLVGGPAGSPPVEVLVIDAVARPTED